MKGQDQADLGREPLVQEARDFYDEISEYESDWRSKFLDDIKFANGDSYNNYQWPNAERRQREIDRKPCLTMNVVRQHNNQISNAARKNKSEPRVLAMGNGATQESALMLRQIIRHIEYQSQAQDAYTVAREFQVDGGVGYWRITTDYASPETFDQEIFIRMMLDPLSVFMDQNSQRLDGSDAKRCIVFNTMVPREEFELEYPEFASYGNFAPLGMANTGDSWIEQHHVTLAEFWKKVSLRDTLISFVYQGQRVEVLKSRLPPSVLAEVMDLDLTRTRPTFSDQIKWYLIAGEHVIDETIWPGKYIPIVRCLGRQMVIEGRLDRVGHTRSMLSAQHMYNYNAPLALDTQIPTPSGWTTMGELERGCIVFDENGRPCEVAGTSPVFEDRKCFEITFDDGSTIVADAEHRWKVEERGKRKTATWEWTDKIVTTAELQKKKHYINVAKPLELDFAELPISPYVLGVWLGDGTSSSGSVTASMGDIYETQANILAAGHAVGEVHEYPYRGGSATFTILGIRSNLVNMNLLNDKHIPIDYLRAADFQRLSLIQGLMDTDGHFSSDNNQCTFVNGNVEIARGFTELLSSFGIKFQISVGKSQAKIFPNGKEYTSKATLRISFTVDPDLQMFRLERKRIPQQRERSTHWRRTKRFGITSVAEVASVPVKCISVNSETHLFLAGTSMIPTHNSSQVEFGGTQGKTPWIVAAKAIEEYETYWNTANTTNHSVLPWNHVDDDNPDRPVPPPIRAEPPNFAPLYEKGMETAFNQMMMVSGQWQNQMGMMGNERTGAAIGARQEQGDTATFHFQDNYESALVFSTRQLLDLIPRIYDTRRVLACQADDGMDYELEIDPQARQAFVERRAYDGKIIQRIFNPNLGKYDVAASVGPAIGTGRQQTQETLGLILSQNPGLTGIIGDLLLKVLDFPEAQEAAQRLRRMVPPQALGTGPSEQEQQLQQAVQLLQQNLAKSLDAHGKDRVKLIGKDQMRDIDAYDAETKRMTALQKMLPQDAEGLQALISQLVEDSLHTSLLPILSANVYGVQEEGGEQGSAEQDTLMTPPLPGAQRSPQDGEWYILDPTRRSKYLRISPLAQERAPARGVISGG